MRKKSTLQMMVFLLGIALSISGAPINFADDLANWKQLRIGCEKSVVLRLGSRRRDALLVRAVIRLLLLKG